LAETNTSAAIAGLKSTPAPKFLRVKEYDTESIAKIAVPDVKRWKSRVAKILDSIRWEWVEPLDAKDNILGPRIDNPELHKAGELEEFEEPEMTGKVSSELAAFQGLMSLFLKGQDMALVRQRQAYADVLDNNQQLLKIISERQQKAEQHAQQSFEVITALHNRLNLETMNNGEDGDDLDSMAKDVLGSVLKAKLIGDGRPQTSGVAGSSTGEGTK
jgi:hypothetical protein